MSSPSRFMPKPGLMRPFFLPQLCVVGKEFNEGVTSWPEGVIFDYNVRGCHLLLIYKDPTEQEKNDFSDTAKFALFYKYNTIFILCKFGDMLWQDCPYSYWLVSDDARPDPRADLLKPGNRMFLHCFLINASTGILEGMRALTFSPEFTTQLLQCTIEQSLIPTAVEAHSRTVASIYSQYPTSKAMVRNALVQCRGGD